MTQRENWLIRQAVDLANKKKSSSTTIVQGSSGSSTPTTFVAKTRGADIASTTTIAIPDTVSDIFYVTGTTTITSITAQAPERVIILHFTGALTLTDGSNLNLTGNYVTAAGDEIILRCDGATWFEIARSNGIRSIASSDGSIVITNSSGPTVDLSVQNPAGIEKGDLVLELVKIGTGVDIATGQKQFLRIPFDCTITGWTIVADVACSIVVDIWSDTYGNFPPTVADTITGSAKPTLSSAVKNTSTTLTGWNTSLLAGNVLLFNVDSISGSPGKVNLAVSFTRIGGAQLTDDALLVHKAGAETITGDKTFSGAVVTVLGASKNVETDASQNLIGVTKKTAFNKDFGTIADTIAQGNDSRFTDSRIPIAHKTTHEPGGSDALTALTDASIAAANKDGTAVTPSMRTLGTGAQQAMPGNATIPAAYTDEQAQDAIGAEIDSTLVYVDATPLLTRAAITGDVTIPQASNVATIPNDTVTNAKLANVATSTIKGRVTAGTGDPEDLTAVQVRGILNVNESPDVVHIAETETITGEKTFNAELILTTDLKLNDITEPATKTNRLYSVALAWASSLLKWNGKFVALFETSPHSGSPPTSPPDGALLFVNTTGTGGNLDYDGTNLGYDTSTHNLKVTGKITNVTDPTNAQDVVTKAYLEAHAGTGTIESIASTNGTIKVTNAEGPDVLIDTYTANARTTSDVTTTSTTAVDITGLSFAIAANEVWSFEASLFQQRSNSGRGSKYAANAPSGATLLASRSHTLDGSFSGIQIITAIDTLGNTVENSSNDATNVTVTWKGVVANGSTAGTVQLRFATVNADNTAKVMANSYITARKIS